MKCILYKKALPLILLSCLLLGACGNSKMTVYLRSLFPILLPKRAPGTLLQRCLLQLPTAHKPIHVM